MRKKPSMLFVFSAFAALIACGCHGPAPTSAIALQAAECQGDGIAKQFGVIQCLAGSNIQVLPNVPIAGVTFPSQPQFFDYIVNGVDETQGTVSIYGYLQNPAIDNLLYLTTGPKGLAVINNARAPAYWDVYFWPSEFCGALTANSSGQGWVYQGAGTIADTPYFGYYYQQALIQNYYPSGTTGLQFDCVQYGTLLPASTRFAILGSLPETLTLGSTANFTTTYGMPLLYIYDAVNGSPNLVTTETATSVSSDGSQATFPFPSSLSQNGYSLAVLNQIPESPGALTTGTNLLSIASSQTIAGNPFGVAIAGQSDVTVTCTYVPTPPYGGYTECPSTTTYVPVPVVSLYSANQVLIGGTAVNVGPNPTAVAAYTASPVTTTNGNVTLTQAAQAQGLVANSGSNTVSILNLVNPGVISNVTVGNQPVALAVTSSGSTAYVANYTDSTVTPVNLSTHPAGTAVAVGGHPTSAALTSTGTLWVGGAGFLTEINTSNMSVVGTESVSGKTIVSLGYTDAYNELAVSSVDTSGNVYVEEVASSSFEAGGTYAPAASQVVSSVGTYLNPSTDTNVKGYTSTLAKASPTRINTFQPGAPPLVVQDGWAVITATPTGFTITELSGNQVLVSQTTPSPITAIAVDPNLNIAYLTEPDSNTLLIVPLPGVTAQ